MAPSFSLSVVVTISPIFMMSSDLQVLVPFGVPILSVELSVRGGCSRAEAVEEAKRDANQNRLHFELCVIGCWIEE
jgi:hypothetical protein